MGLTVTFPNQQTVCALGQGTWRMGELLQKKETEIRALQLGLDLGLTVIDTAEMYANGQAEEVVGEAIAGRREEVFLVTKVLPSNASKKGTKQACEKSLRRLRTDVVDLYLLHWAGSYPFEETVEAMLELVAEGKIRQWGVSNMNVADMNAFMSIPGGETCAANQVLYNLTRRGIEYDLIPWCESHQIPIMAYSPIEQGRLLNDPDLVTMAQKYEATPAQVALAWVLRKENILAIPKTGSLQHVQENAGSLEIQLDQEDFDTLDQLFPPPNRSTPLEVL